MSHAATHDAERRTRVCVQHHHLHGIAVGLLHIRGNGDQHALDSAWLGRVCMLRGGYQQVQVASLQTASS